MSATHTPAGARRTRRRVDLSRPSDRAALVAIAIAAALILVIWSPNVSVKGPGDPAAVAGDARLARCGNTADAEYAFVVPRARDYQVYLPAMPRTPQLELDLSALVVVYRAPITVATFAPTAPSAPLASSGARRVPPPTPKLASLRNVCIYVGAAGEGESNFFTDVSIVGLRVTPNGPVLVPPPST